MSFRLGVDVGGTFTDFLLLNEDTGETFTAKVPVHARGLIHRRPQRHRAHLRGIGRRPGAIHRVMHGTTVATNAVLTHRGAKVGLVTTAGFEDTLQVARSFCPGGLGGWVSYVKSPLLAPLELTIGATERIGADGEVVTPSMRTALRRDLEALRDRGEVEALTICLINAYINPEHERRVAAIAAEMFPDTPISVSADVVPEMQEYERTETTVVNSYVRPEVARYVGNLQAALDERLGERRAAVHPALRRRPGLGAGRRRIAGQPAHERSRRRRRRRDLLLRAGRLTATSSPSTWAAPPRTSP
jgi:N-methylhydantoinase A